MSNFKKILIALGVGLVCFVISVLSSFLLLSGVLKIPFVGAFDITKYFPEKKVVIENRNEIRVDSNLRLQDEYKNTSKYIVYIAEKKSDNKYSESNILNLGFILTSDGYIFTNNQSIFNKTKKYVAVLSDGRFYDVTNVIFDSYDFVLLKIDNSKMDTPPFAFYDDVNVGSTVLENKGVFGFYINYINNKKNGYLSLLNPSYSGVFLLDMSDNIIGLIGKDSDKTVILPSNYLKNIINSLSSDNYLISRPVLSIKSHFTDFITSSVVRNGILIDSIDPKNNYGFVAGDLIVTVQGIDVNADLNYVLQNYKVGDKVDFTVLRGGKEVLNSVVLK